MEHHHGYDFKKNKATAKCRCGRVTQNPYYKVGINSVNRMPLIKGEK